MSIIKNTWPNFEPDEIERVVNVLKSGKVNYWTGEETKSFETEFADYVGSKKAIAVANGTLALDLALHGLFIGGNNSGSYSDEVIVTPRSFIASASTISNAGAVPVFADVCGDSGNIDAEQIKELITDKTKALLVVHLAGWPCEMDTIMSLAKEFKLKVIEDCAQAHGAIYKGQMVGSIGDVGVWSFCQDKIMTTGGEGGMVASNCDDTWSRMWSFKDHGKNHEKITTTSPNNKFNWVHDSLGTNYRLTEMQSAIGRLQLKKLEGWITKRLANSKFLEQQLSELASKDAIVIPKFRCGDCNCDYQREQNCRNANYKFYFYINRKKLKKGWSRERILLELQEKEAPVFNGSCSEIYLEKAFKGIVRSDLGLPIAADLGKRSLMCLVHPTITASEMRNYAGIIKVVLNEAFDLDN